MNTEKKLQELKAIAERAEINKHLKLITSQINDALTFGIRMIKKFKP